MHELSAAATAIIISNYTRWQRQLQAYWCGSEYDGGNLTRLSNIRVIIISQTLVPYLLSHVMPLFVRVSIKV